MGLTGRNDTGARHPSQTPHRTFACGDRVERSATDCEMEAADFVGVPADLPHGRESWEWAAQPGFMPSFCTDDHEAWIQQRK